MSMPWLGSSSFETLTSEIWMPTSGTHIHSHPAAGVLLYSTLMLRESELHLLWHLTPGNTFQPSLRAFRIRRPEFQDIFEFIRPLTLGKSLEDIVCMHVK